MMGNEAAKEWRESRKEGNAGRIILCKPQRGRRLDPRSNGPEAFLEDCGVELSCVGLWGTLQMVL